MSYRVVVGNDVKIQHLFLDGSIPTDPDGVVNVTVTRDDGTVLASLVADPVDGHPGLVEVTLDATTYTSQLDVLRLTWSTTVLTMTVVETSKVKVVGGRYFSLHALRSMEGLTSHNNYSDEDLEYARMVAESRIESFCEKAFVPQLRTETHDSRDFFGKNFGHLYVRRVPVRQLRSVVIDDVVQTLTNWTITSYGLLRADKVNTEAIDNIRAYTGQDMVVTFEYGDDGPEPDLARAALQYARHIAMHEQSTIPQRARMMQSEFGLFALDTAGKDKPTSLPEVDSVLVEYRHEDPVGFA